MVLTDEEFREEYKPLLVPPHFDTSDTQENKMIYALAQINEGTADEVIAELEKLEQTPPDEQRKSLVRHTLADLYDKGLLAGSETSGVMHYNLHKITQANSGGTDPDLLAPGLD